MNPKRRAHSDDRWRVRRWGVGAAGGERGRGGDGFGVEPVRRVGAAGVLGSRAIVAAEPHVGRRGRRTAAALHAAAHCAQGGPQRRAARPRARVHGLLALGPPGPRGPHGPLGPQRPPAALSTSGRPRARSALRILDVSVASEIAGGVVRSPRCFIYFVRTRSSLACRRSRRLPIAFDSSVNLL